MGECPEKRTSRRDKNMGERVRCVYPTKKHIKIPQKLSRTHAHNKKVTLQCTNAPLVRYPG